MSLVRNQQVRCFCTKRPILGILVDGDERRFFHVKAFKAQRIMADVKVFDGEFIIQCRDCNRRHEVKMNQDNFKIHALPDVQPMVDLDGSYGVSSQSR